MSPASTAAAGAGDADPRPDAAGAGGSRTVLLTLGSNIDPEHHLPAALDELEARLGIEAVSSFYEAEPVGSPGSPRFLNAAVRLRTAQPPLALKFDVLRPLERHLGRVRTDDPNAPRTIDIDIAVVEDLVLDRRDLRLPDPDIARRAHLAFPLADVAPDFRHPTEGRTLAEIAAGFGAKSGVARRDDVRWP